MTAKYQKEQEKVKAVVDAEKVKAVAELQAEQRLAVAKLDKKAAAETKQKNILLGQGEAERKKLVLLADGALKQKLSAYVEAQKLWADAFSKRNVPSVYNAGGGKAGQRRWPHRHRQSPPLRRSLAVPAVHAVAKHEEHGGSRSRHDHQARCENQEVNRRA